VHELKSVLEREGRHLPSGVFSGPQGSALGGTAEPDMRVGLRGHERMFPYSVDVTATGATEGSHRPGPCVSRLRVSLPIETAMLVRVLTTCAIAGLIAFAVGCGGTVERQDAEPAPTQTVSQLSSEDEARILVPALSSVGDVTVTAVALFACDDQTCLKSNGKALASTVNRATRAVAQGLMKIETDCLRSGSVALRTALRAHERGALSAQGGSKERTFEILDNAAELIYAARDHLFSCSSVWPEETQAAALDVGAMVSTINAIGNAMYACTTLECVGTQGKLMESAAGTTLDAYDSALEHFAVSSQPSRCRKVSQLTRRVLLGYRSYGRAGRMLDPGRIVREFNLVNRTIAQRQQQIETCISGG